MDLIDVALEEGQVKASETAEMRAIWGDEEPIVGLGQNMKNRETNLQNGISPLEFLKNPLPQSKEQDFARLKRLLPHP